jgi:chromosome segregation ATPase
MAESPIGERVVKLETRMETAESEIAALRQSRGQHAGQLERLYNAPEDIRELNKLPPRIDRLEEDQESMITKVLPTQSEAIKALEKELAQIRDKVLTRSTDVSWLTRILAWTLQLAQAAGLIYVAYLVSHH